MPTGMSPTSKLMVLAKPRRDSERGGDVVSLAVTAVLLRAQNRWDWRTVLALHQDGARGLPVPPASIFGIKRRS